MNLSFILKYNMSGFYGASRSILPERVSSGEPGSIHPLETGLTAPPIYRLKHVEALSTVGSSTDQNADKSICVPFQSHFISFPALGDCTPVPPLCLQWRWRYYHAIQASSLSLSCLSSEYESFSVACLLQRHPLVPYGFHRPCWCSWGKRAVDFFVSYCGSWVELLQSIHWTCVYGHSAGA